MMSNIFSTLGAQLQRRLVLLLLGWLMIGCSNDLQEEEELMQAYYDTPKRHYGPSEPSGRNIALIPSSQQAQAEYTSPDAYKDDTLLLEKVSAGAHHEPIDADSINNNTIHGAASADDISKHNQADENNMSSTPDLHGDRQPAAMRNEHMPDNKPDEAKEKGLKKLSEENIYTRDSVQNNDASNATPPLGNSAASDNGVVAYITNMGTKAYGKLKKAVYGKTAPNQSHSIPATTYQSDHGVFASITKRGTEAYGKLKEAVYGKTTPNQTHSDLTIIDPTQSLHQRLTGQLERRAERVRKAAGALREASREAYKQDTEARQAHNQERAAREVLTAQLRPITSHTYTYTYTYKEKYMHKGVEKERDVEKEVEVDLLENRAQQLPIVQKGYDSACLERDTKLQAARNAMIAAKTQVEQLRSSAAELARQEKVAKKKGLITSQGKIWAQVAYSQAVAAKTASVIARNARRQCRLFYEQLEGLEKYHQEIKREEPPIPQGQKENPFYKQYSTYLSHIKGAFARTLEALRKEVAKAEHAAKLAQAVATDAKKALKKAKNAQEVANNIGQIIEKVDATKKQANLAKKAAKDASQRLKNTEKNENFQDLLRPAT